MPFRLSAKFIARNGCIENEMTILRMQFFRLNVRHHPGTLLHRQVSKPHIHELRILRNKRHLITAGIKIVKILYVRWFGKCNRNGIHSMVTIVITLGPILYLSYSMTIFIHIIGQAQFVIFIPVKFLHHIHKSPIFTKPFSNASNGGRNHPHHTFKNFPRFLRNILRISKISFKETLGHAFSGSQQILSFCTAQRTFLDKITHTVFIFR